MLPILLWCFIAPQAERLEAFMPDNTALAISLNPKETAVGLAAFLAKDLERKGMGNK